MEPLIVFCQLLFQILFKFIQEELHLPQIKLTFFRF